MLAKGHHLEARNDRLTSSSGSHDGGHTWEGKTKNASEGIVDAHSPGHALLTLDRGENLGRVLESDGTFSERVHDGEQVDKSV